MKNLDLGCGGLQKKEGFIGVDICDYINKYPVGEFIQADLFYTMPFEDNSIEEVFARHFIEHIPQDRVIWFFNEIYRILVLNGIFEIFVPPTQSPDGKACRGAFCDPTHRSYWNDMSFRYFDMSWCGQLSESYGIKCNFKILENKFLSEHNQHVILKKVS